MERGGRFFRFRISVRLRQKLEISTCQWHELLNFDDPETSLHDSGERHFYDQRDEFYRERFSETTFDGATTSEKLTSAKKLRDKFLKRLSVLKKVSW